MEEIHHGFQGSVYRLEKNSKVYSVKRLKISEEEATELKKKLKGKLTIEDITNGRLREIYFAKFIKKINKNHFLKFYKFKIFKCLNHKTKLTHNMEHENSKKYCIDLIYDLKDGDLSNIYENLNKNEFISMIIQILYAAYLMHSHNFYHQDIRTCNICYMKTTETHIKIFKYNIPTYGYIFSLIDYGCIWNKNFVYKHGLDEYNYARRNYNYEDNIVMLTHAFLYNGDFLKCENLIDIVRNFYKIIYKIENKKKISEENIDFYNMNANKFLNLDDTKYFIKNLTNERKLIKYFYNKLN